MDLRERIKWSMPRPEKRDDGIPTRVDLRWQSDGELTIGQAMQVIERMGASPSLTRAVTLLDEAKSAVADHVEGKTELAAPDDTQARLAAAEKMLSQNENLQRAAQELRGIKSTDDAKGTLDW